MPSGRLSLRYPPPARDLKTRRLLPPVRSQEFEQRAHKSRGQPRKAATGAWFCEKALCRALLQDDLCACLRQQVINPARGQPPTCFQRLRRGRKFRGLRSKSRSLPKLGTESCIQSEAKNEQLCNRYPFLYPVNSPVAVLKKLIFVLKVNQGNFRQCDCI